MKDIMQSQPKRSIVVAIGTAAVMAILWSGTKPAVGQTSRSLQSPMQTPITYKAPRTGDGQPDLSGFWQAVNTANWNIEDHGAQPAPYQGLVGAYLAQPAGFSVVEGGEIPYKPEALARRKAHFEGRLHHDPLLPGNLSKETSDPEAKCFQGGVPRATYMPFPFQVVQAGNKVFMAYEYGRSARVIHLDQRFDDLLPINTWMGQSVGRWEADTLVVETQWFSDDPWLDRAGNFVSENARVVERYTPISPHHLKYEATIEDPDTFTRPWKMSMPLYRRIEPNMQLLEFECIPFAEEFMYGTLKKKAAK